MLNLTALDIGLIVVYLVIVLYLGYRSSKKETSEGFLLADRNLGVFTNAATIVSSKTGAGLVLTFVTLIYLFGTSAMLFFVGASVGYIIFMFFATNLRKRSSEKRYYTLSDYFFDKYGTIIGYTSAFVILVVMLLNFIIQLVGGAKVLNALTGTSFILSLSLISITILLYLILGGFKAVVKTDIAQFLAIIVLTALLGILMFSGVQVSSEDFNFTKMPIKNSLGFFIFGIVLPFASAELWQRVYASKSVKSIRKSLIASAFLYILIGILFLFVGLAIKDKAIVGDPDIALVEGLIQLLPSGLVGLGVVTIFAAVMSSADTYLFTNTSILLQDFYSRDRIIDRASLVKLFRYALVFLMGIGFIIAIILKSVLGTAFIFTGFASVIALTGLASWLVKRIRRSTLFFGMVFGFLGTLVFVIAKPVTETLVISSIGFTIFGFLFGWVMNLLSGRKIS